MTLVKKNRLTLTQAVHLLAEKPAEIFGLNDRGRLEQGKNADLTVVDFNRQFKIEASKFKSKAKFSPYDGWDVQGKVVKTIVNGQVVFDEGEIVANGGSGLVVRRGRGVKFLADANAWETDALAANVGARCLVLGAV